MITRSGIEGGAVYALSADLREASLSQGRRRCAIALRPDLDSERSRHAAVGATWKTIIVELAAQGGASLPGRYWLVAGGGDGLGVSLSSLSAEDLAERINAVPVELTGLAPIARAISTAGGIAFDELDANFMIRRLPGIFAAGEMLDWEAPTGGYLLQASFATGAAAGRGALEWLTQRMRE